MNWSNQVILWLVFLFIVYTTLKGNLHRYLAVLVG